MLKGNMPNEIDIQAHNHKMSCTIINYVAPQHRFLEIVSWELF